MSERGFSWPSTTLVCTAEYTSLNMMRAGPARPTGPLLMVRRASAGGQVWGLEARLLGRLLVGNLGGERAGGNRTHADSGGAGAEKASARDPGHWRSPPPVSCLLAGDNSARN